METIIVIVVVSVALLTLFSSYNKILSKVKTDNTYDNPEYVYMTHYIKNKLSVDSLVFDMNKEVSINNPLNEYSSLLSTAETSTFNIKKVYLVTNVGKELMTTNLKYFDAYMIDYLKNLDVNTYDKLIIVEYSKLEKDESFVDKKIYCSEIRSNNKYCSDSNENNLYKTYIASIKW